MTFSNTPFQERRQKLYKELSYANERIIDAVKKTVEYPDDRIYRAALGSRYREWERTRDAYEHSIPTHCR